MKRQEMENMKKMVCRTKYTTEDKKTIIANYYLGSKKIVNISEEYSIASATLYKWSSELKEYFKEVQSNPEETQKYLHKIEKFNKKQGVKEKASKTKKEVKLKEEKNFVLEPNELVEKVNRTASEYEMLKELFQENKKTSSQLLQEKETQLLMANQKIQKLEAKIETLKGILSSVLG